MASTDQTYSETGVPPQKEAGFPPFESDSFTGQIFWLILTFAALYYVISKIAAPRIGAILESRQGRIEGDLAEAESLKHEMDKAIADYESALRDAREQAHQIAQDTQAKLTAKVTSKRQAVEDELAQTMREADARIRAMTGEALSHVEEIACESVNAVITHIDGRTCPSDDVKDAVRKFHAS